MPTLNEELLNILLDLSEEQFNRFKFYLRDDGILEGLSKIPLADLEKAKRPDTVELMINRYRDRGALKVTLKVLQKIGRNDLVERLQNFRPKDFNLQEKARPLRWVQQFAVEVTLDHNTAHPNLMVSDDGKQVKHGDVRKELPDSPKRFNSSVNVLGKQSFSSRRFYFEVQVRGKRAWTVGVAKESINRRGKITLGPGDGFWTVWLRNGNEYMANDDQPVRLSLNQRPQKVGVFVDYEEGLVSFYDVDSADLLYTFTDCSFPEKLYPFFSPCTNDKGRNSAPLIICPVNRNN